MDKLFSRLARLSTMVVFIVLLGSVISLYISARPAIQEFGSYFLVDPRWGVEVEIEQTGSDDQTEGDKRQHVQIQDSEINKDVDLEAAEAVEPSLDSDEDSVFVDELAMMDEMDDEVVPIEDETATGQAELTAEGHVTTKTMYGGAVAIVGTVFSTIIALLFAVPISMGIAVFLSEIARPAVAQPVGIAVELLAAIPSIIYGMWGLFYFGPFLASIFGGNSVSLLVGGLVLGVMIIPFMAALSRDAINTTPDILKEAAYSMGATKTEVIKDIIFPYAKAGIIGSMIVSLGRALGETMAVAFVIGGVYQFASKVTDPTISIPVALANNFSESSGLSLSVLFYLALILFVVSFVIIFSAKYFFLRRGKIK